MENKNAKKELFAGIPKVSWGPVIALWGSLCFNANSRELINRLLPYITIYYAISATQASYISSIAFIATAIGAVPLASLCAKKGWYGWKMKYGVLICGAGHMFFTFLCGIEPLVSAFGVLLFIQFVRGFFTGGGEGIDVGNTAEWVPVEAAGFSMGINHTGFPWGTFIGGLVVTATLAIVGEDNWRVCFIVVPAIALVVYSIFMKIANEKRYKKFEDVTKRNNLTLPLDGELVEGDYIPPKGLVWRCLKNPNILSTAICALFVNTAYLGIVFWLPLYLAFVAGYDYTVVASLSVVFMLTGGIGQIVWGKLSDHFGTKRVIIILGCGWTVTLFLMQFVYLGLGWYIGLQLLFGCFANAIFPVFYNNVYKVSERGGRATANGIINVGNFIGGIIGTPIVGICIDIGGGYDIMSGYTTSLMLLAAMTGIGTLVVALFSRETVGKRAGKGWALVSMKSMNMEDIEVDEKDKK